MKLCHVFGPVSSRRLGSSLGVRNVPYKVCTYSCIYCQAGPTTVKTVRRTQFYDLRELIKELEDVVKSVEVNYVTFVPSGEPTLDIQLGKAARLVKKFGRRVAVLTNASLLWLSDVIEDLMVFDYVSLKIDAVNEDLWRRINRPHKSIALDQVLSGVKEFTKKYNGLLTTETMLVHGVNDTEDHIENLAKFIKGLRVDKAYISIPVRPPTEKWVKPPTEEALVKAYSIFVKHLGEKRVEVLSSLEPPPSYRPKNIIDYILNTVATHPLKLDYVIKLLSSYYSNPEEKLEELVRSNYVVIVEHLGQKFVVRRFR
ncbi:MAG: radical SAM protein [Thermoprotei archaeon]|nr:MAG: radical SAM protein [Thermoprotei archaeon]